MLLYIDVNVPFVLTAWKGAEPVYIKDIDDSMSDSDIWTMAKLNGAVIISRDSDFHRRIIHSFPPPKVVYLNLGNIKTKEFASLLDRNWISILELIKEHKLVTVHADKLEALR
jgi:predicted nuclease of predicted toxin-antitoxin system